MTTDTSEKGLESLIIRHMTGTDGFAVAPNSVAKPPTLYGGIGYIAGSAQDFDRAHAIDVYQLFAFLSATQPDAYKKLGMLDPHSHTDVERRKFLTRLSAEVGKRGGRVQSKFWPNQAQTARFEETKLSSIILSFTHQTLDLSLTRASLRHRRQT